MTRVRCGTCSRRMWWRRWCRHERRRHGGFATFTLAPRRHPTMPTQPDQPPNYLPGGVQLLGTTRCSEAEPQCVSVGRNLDGDLVLANHRGEVLVATPVEFVEAVEIALFGDRA